MRLNDDYARTKYIFKLNIGAKVRIQTVLDLSVLHDIKAVMAFICQQLGMPKIDQLELVDKHGKKVTDIAGLLQNEWLCLSISNRGMPNDLKHLTQMTQFDSPSSRQLAVPPQQNLPQNPQNSLLKKRGRPKKSYGDIFQGINGITANKDQIEQQLQQAPKYNFDCKPKSLYADTPPKEVKQFLKRQQKRMEKEKLQQQNYEQNLNQLISNSSKLLIDYPIPNQQQPGSPQYQQDQTDSLGKPIFTVSKTEGKLSKKQLKEAQVKPIQNVDLHSQHIINTVETELLDRTKEIIQKQQQQSMVDHLKIQEIPDKVQTFLINKIVQRFKAKPHLFTSPNMINIFEVIASATMNKFDEEGSNQQLSEVQKNMKKLQLIIIGVTSFLQMTVNKSRTTGLVKDGYSRIMNIILDKEQKEPKVQTQIQSPPATTVNLPLTNDFINKIQTIQAKTRADLCKQVFEIAKNKGISLELDQQQQYGFLNTVTFRKVDQQNEDQYLSFKCNIIFGGDKVYTLSDKQWNN